MNMSCLDKRPSKCIIHGLVEKHFVREQDHPSDRAALTKSGDVHHHQLQNAHPHHPYSYYHHHHNNLITCQILVMGAVRRERSRDRKSCGANTWRNDEPSQGSEQFVRSEEARVVVLFTKKQIDGGRRRWKIVLMGELADTV